MTSSLTNCFGKSNSSSSSSVKDKTLSWIGNLVKLLPTGTVFVFQFLNPVLTKNGQCAPLQKKLSAILIGLCGLSCLFSCFTDSYTGSDNRIHYGIVTLTGLWPSTAATEDLSKYKLRLGDFVHAFLTVIVFAVLSLLDANTVSCFYPSFKNTETVLMQALPPAIGFVAGAVFMFFPNKRHGIGYPSSKSEQSESSSK